ncbi:MAG TPA: twin-arginine translocase subunit TatC [Marmoricola sp.]|nr:twin-arginine translocase subunit TatC [Marmoricola sp.]
MSVVGVLDLFRGRPRGGVSEGGRMSLGDHFRELRARIMRIALYLVVGTVIALFFWHQLFGLIFEPYNQARQMLGGEVTTRAVITGAGGALMLQLKLCAVAALVGTSPLWLMEIWGFVVPGLHPHERRWTKVFAAVAGPLFLVGVGVGYYVLPKGLQVLISFTPAHVENLIEFGDYFSFMTRMLLVFGIAFEIPLFVVLLNLAGVVSGRALGRHRPWIIVLTFVFAAVATPSTDPFSMLMLALPMTALLMVSEGIARLVDRRRSRQREARMLSGWADDEASPL